MDPLVNSSALRISDWTLQKRRGLTLFFAGFFWGTRHLICRLILREREELRPQNGGTGFTGGAGNGKILTLQLVGGGGEVTNGIVSIIFPTSIRESQQSVVR